MIIRTPYEDLLSEAQSMQDFLESEYADDIHSICIRGDQLSAYIPRLGKMLADSKYWLNEALGSRSISVINEIIGKQLKLSSKVQNAMIDGICRDYQYLVDWVERLNKSAVHQQRWCITQVSKEKELLKLNM